MRLRLTALLFLLLGFTMVSRAQSEARNEGYIESNCGLAAIDGLSSGALFPGTSLLVGRRMFIGNTTFLEGQFGLAFPSLVTAKVGGGWKWDSGWSHSTGIRIWPLHFYAATGIPTQRCNRDISASKQRRLERRGKTTADLKCSEWILSFELSLVGLGETVLPKLKEHPNYDEWEEYGFYSYGMITVGHRWMF